MTSSVIINTMSMSKSNAALVIERNFTRLSSGVPRLLALFLSGVGIGLIGLLIVRDDLLTLNRPTVRGTVVASTTTYDTNDNPIYTPTVRYLVEGKPYTVLSAYGVRDRLKNGEDRVVAYDKDNPAGGIVRRGGAAQLPYVFVVIGALLVTASGILLVFDTAKRK